LGDFKTTPICTDFPGVQVPATIIDNILAGDVLRMPEWMEGATDWPFFSWGFYYAVHP